MGRKAFIPGVFCKMCGDWVEVLTHKHMEIRHGIRQFEYLVQYPEHCESTLWGDENGYAARLKYARLKNW